MIIFEAALALTAFLIFALVLLAIPALIFGSPVLLFVRSIVRARRRQLQIKQFADAAGWQFVARDDRVAPRGRRPPFDLPDPRAVNVLSRTVDNRQVVVFQYVPYSATPAAGLSVCAVALPTLLPYVEVGPRSVTALIEAPIGTRSIEIESEDFNRRFTVWADDAKYASDVLPPRLAAELLDGPPYRWRLEGDYFLSWTEGSFETGSLGQWVAAVLAILDAIPEFVWHEYGPALPPAEIVPCGEPAGWTPSARGR